MVWNSAAEKDEAFETLCEELEETGIIQRLQVGPPKI